MGMHLACVMFIDRNVTRIKRLGAEELGREATQSLVILPLPLVRQEPRGAGPALRFGHLRTVHAAL
jgi:hypothetical protein